MNYPARLVLDTNIVLDWLVFRDPSLGALPGHIETERVVVVSHSLTVSELERVLDYPQLNLTPTRQRTVLECYRAHTAPAAVPNDFSARCLSLPQRFPRCRDRDDELFLALAYHIKADALVTRDRAVLKLQSRAARFGVHIKSTVEMRAAFAPLL